jgi:hypothetical protein
MNLAIFTNRVEKLSIAIAYLVVISKHNIVNGIIIPPPPPPETLLKAEKNTSTNNPPTSSLKKGKTFL